MVKRKAKKAGSVKDSALRKLKHTTMKRFAQLQDKILELQNRLVDYQERLTQVERKET